MNKTIEELAKRVSDEIGGILRSNLYETVLGEEELIRLRKKKTLLREALKNCGIGDNNAKEYVKETILVIFKEKFKLDEESVERIIPFEKPYNLSVRERFDIILYLYMKIHGDRALAVMIEEYVKDSLEFTEDMVDAAFQDCYCKLSFEDKLCILTQQVYSHYRGLGVIDDIRDMRIDGVLGGVSGRTGEYNSAWIVYKGVMIHFSFLDFEKEEELRRICMNIYRYDNPKQLSRTSGYVVNQMKDYSRVVVVRPPFAESYGFFVRKFNSIEKKEIGELITDANRELPIRLIKWLVKGCQTIAITGMQGSGKTTLLMSLIDFIHPAYSIRVQEMSFELHLREVYSDRNIMTFRETDSISGQEGLDLQKKTDGNVNILGEVASNPVAAWMIQMTQSGSIFTMFTHHAKTTDSLVKYMRNSLLSCNIFGDEIIATEQVVEAIRFDIHLNKSIDGHRYIERINEIIEEPTERARYSVREIVVWENNRYRIVNNISDKTKVDIRHYLNQGEDKEFCEDMDIWNNQEAQGI